MKKISNEEIENKSMRYSILVYLVISLIIIITDMINASFCPQHLIALLSFLIVYRAINYKCKREKKQLIWIIIFSLALIGSIGEYINILR